MDEIHKHKRLRKLEAMHDDFITRAEDLYLENKIPQKNYPKLNENFDALLLLGSCYQYRGADEENISLALDCYLQADKLDSRNPFVKNLIGYIYMVQNLSNEALLYFRDAVNYDTNNILFRQNLAVCYEKLGENQSAKKEYIEILELDHQNIKSMINLGILDSIDGDFKSGLIYLTKAKELLPNDPKIFFNIGNIHLKEKNYIKAIENFKNSLNLEPENLKALESLMISQLKIEKWDELISTSRKILQIENTNTKAIALLAKALKENNRYKDLENLLNKLEQKADILEQKYKNSNDEVILSNIKKLKFKIRKKLKDIKKSKLIYHQLDVPDEVKDHSELSNKNIEMDENENNVSLDDPKIYLNTLKQDESNKEALFNLGVYYYRKQDFQVALDYFKKLTVAGYINISVVYQKIGDIYYKHYKDMESALEYYNESLNRNKTDICYIKLGRCYAVNNNEEKEEENYKKALEINNDQEWANFFMGNLYVKQNKTDEGIIYLRKAYELDKTNINFILKYSEELSKSKNKKDLDLSLEILKNAKISFPNKIDLHIMLSNIYQKINEYEKAIEILEEANRHSDFYNNPDKLFKLGVVYEKMNEYSKALSVFKMILILKKDHTQSLCHVGFILGSTKEYKRSLKYFKYAIKVNPGIAYAYYGIAKIFQAIGNFEDALEYYALAIEKNSTNFKSYFNMGLIQLELKEFDKAKILFEETIHLNPIFNLSYVGLGNVYYETGDYESAETYHFKAYNMEKKDLQVLISYANTLMSLEKYEEALGIYQEALEIDRNLSEIHINIANVYYLLDRYDEAINHYIQVIRKNDDRKSDAYYNLGNSLCVKKMYKEAIKCFKKVIKYDTNNVEAIYNLGNCYLAMGLFKKAVEKYEICQKLDMDTKEVKVALSKSLIELADKDTLNKAEAIVRALLLYDGNDPELYLLMGMLKEKSHLKAEAVQYYKKTLNLDNFNLIAKQKLEILEKSSRMSNGNIINLVMNNNNLSVGNTVNVKNLSSRSFKSVKVNKEN